MLGFDIYPCYNTFMLNFLLISAGKIFSRLVKSFNLGHGSTWPGHIALQVNKDFIRDILRKSRTKLIIVTGTNGKTTTSKLIAHILEKSGSKVFLNESGANLLNGIASSILLNATFTGKLDYDFAIFESDENALPHILKEISPDYLIILNLFRDQLDRYGEVNTIAIKWQEAIKKLDKTMLILNADDPAVAYLGVSANAKYFSAHHHGEKELKQIHAVDSIYCPQCGNKLVFKTFTFSHLGNWECKKCGLKRPKANIDQVECYPLKGLYNQYNVHSAVLLAQTIGISREAIMQSLKSFLPAFGRQEEIEIQGKKVQIFLSKNPTGFNESLRTIKKLGAKNILFVLNDRIPDGRDVSWIWDTDIEGILDGKETISISGDRVYDMALRIKYAFENKNLKLKTQKYNSIFKIFEKLEDALTSGLEEIATSETLYILPTYTAMLETRKILTGKKIL